MGTAAAAAPEDLLKLQNLSSTSDLLNRIIANLLYTDDPQKMVERFISIFLTHRPTWADAQTWVMIVFTADEWHLVLDKAQHSSLGI